jgi:hypothetical protein
MIMNKLAGAIVVTASLLVGLVVPIAAYAAQDEQFFASIFLDKKKIGQVHLRLTRGETGEIEELRARASVSLLGIKLYEFTQDLNQTWKEGELQTMKGNADDNGKSYDVAVDRGSNQYQGTVNTTAVTLPIKAFPNTLWHYGIVDHDLLFKQTDLELLHVKVVEAKETIKLHGKSVAAMRATISGDFNAVVWFDEDKNFLQGAYQMDGRKIRVERDE